MEEKGREETQYHRCGKQNNLNFNRLITRIKQTANR